MKFFRIKYRVVTRYNSTYMLQYRFWWWLFWFDAFFHPFHSLTEVKDILQKLSDRENFKSEVVA